MDKIIETLKQYDIAHNKSNERAESWNSKIDFVEQIILGIVRKATEIPFFDKAIHCFKDKKGRTISFSSGDIPLHDDAKENGFKIIFAPLYNNKIQVCVYKHCIGEREDFETIDIIDNPNDLNEDLVKNIILRGLEKVYTSCYLFMGNTEKGMY